MIYAQCDQSESSALRAREDAGRSDVAFYDKTWCLPETDCVQSRRGWGDHPCQYYRLEQKTDLRFAVFFPLSSQVVPLNYEQRVQRPFNVYFVVTEITR